MSSLCDHRNWIIFIYIFCVDICVYVVCWIYGLDLVDVSFRKVGNYCTSHHFAFYRLDKMTDYFDFASVHFIML